MCMLKQAIFGACCMEASSFHGEGSLIDTKRGGKTLIPAKNFVVT